MNKEKSRHNYSIKIQDTSDYLHDICSSLVNHKLLKNWLYTAITLVFIKNLKHSSDRQNDGSTCITYISDITDEIPGLSPS